MTPRFAGPTLLMLMAMAAPAPAATFGLSTPARGGAEASAIASIEARSVVRLDELARRIDASRDPLERHALDRDVARVKLDADLEILRVRASLARSRGNAAAADGFEATIAMLQAPAFHAPVSRASKAPDDPAAGDAAMGTVATPRDSRAVFAAGIPGIAAAPAERTAAGANLDATATPIGWYAPVVPRSDATATSGSCQPTVTLDPNVQSYASWSWTQTGATLASYRTDLHLDDVLAASFGIGGASDGTHSLLNVALGFVDGGRHTLTSVVDPGNTLAETNESDNQYAIQYIWQPYALSSGVPVPHAAPPSPGAASFPLQNSDGFMFQRPNTSFAWVVSEAPNSANDDYDLTVFDDYSTSTSGFNNWLASAGNSGNRTDFIAGHYAGTPATIYPAVTRFTSNAGAGFDIDAIDAQGRNTTPNANTFWFDETIDVNRLANVYEAYMTAGEDWYVQLHRLSGPATPLIEVYTGAPGVLDLRGTGTPSMLLPNTTEWSVVGPYHAPDTGWHPVVVYRDTGANANQAITYDFAITQVGFLGAPEAVADRTFAFLGATPNPVASHAQFDFVLPAPGRAALALYDVGGRRVRSIADGTFAAGRQSIARDGRDGRGSALAAGGYWARLDAAGRTLSRTIAVMP